MELSGVNNKSLSRYELGTSIPPADVLEISTDALLSDEQVLIKDKVLLKYFEDIQDMTGDTKEIILKFLNLTIRDYKTQQAYK